MKPVFSVGTWVLSLLCSAPTASSAETVSYPAPLSMAPFLFASAAEEIALAKTAAPAAISDHADIWTLGPRGYETAVRGNNGFVCFVDRSWSKPFDDPEFWNPKVRAPQCANAAAARSMLPIVRERTAWVMAGRSKTEITARTRAELVAKTLPGIEPGNMVYMMSKGGFLSESGAPHWHPHIMFYFPTKTLPAWGANEKLVPIVRTDDEAIGITTYFIMVPRWSDGASAATAMRHADD